MSHHTYTWKSVVHLLWRWPWPSVSFISLPSEKCISSILVPMHFWLKLYFPMSHGCTGPGWGLAGMKLTILHKNPVIWICDWVWIIHQCFISCWAVLAQGRGFCGSLCLLLRVSRWEVERQCRQNSWPKIADLNLLSSNYWESWGFLPSQPLLSLAGHWFSCWRCWVIAFAPLPPTSNFLH